MTEDSRDCQLTGRTLASQSGKKRVCFLYAQLPTGAFAPYTEQHFIRAMVLPLAGYAASALLQYLMPVKP